MRYGPCRHRVAGPLASARPSSPSRRCSDMPFRDLVRRGFALAPGRRRRRDPGCAGLLDARRGRHGLVFVVHPGRRHDQAPRWTDGRPAHAALDSSSLAVEHRRPDAGRGRRDDGAAVCRTGSCLPARFTPTSRQLLELARRATAGCAGGRRAGPADRRAVWDGHGLCVDRPGPAATADPPDPDLRRAIPLRVSATVSTHSVRWPRHVRTSRRHPVRPHQRAPGRAIYDPVGYCGGGVAQHSSSLARRRRGRHRDRGRYRPEHRAGGRDLRLGEYGIRTRSGLGAAPSPAPWFATMVRPEPDGCPRPIPVLRSRHALTAVLVAAVPVAGPGMLRPPAGAAHRGGAACQLAMRQLLPWDRADGVWPCPGHSTTAGDRRFRRCRNFTSSTGDLRHGL